LWISVAGPSGTRLASSQSATSTAALPGASSAPAHRGAREEAVGLAEPLEPDRRRLDRVDRRQHLDQHAAEPLADPRLGGDRGRQLPADREARPVLHDHELAADRALVHRVIEAARRQRIDPPDRAQDVVLAPHVVGAGRQLAHRRAAQHPLLAVDHDQIV
jgi:hypothetical protein